MGRVRRAIVTLLGNTSALDTSILSVTLTPCALVMTSVTEVDRSGRDNTVSAAAINRVRFRSCSLMAPMRAYSICHVSQHVKTTTQNGGR